MQNPTLRTANEKRPCIAVQSERINLDGVRHTEQLFTRITPRITKEEQASPAATVQIVESVRKIRIDLLARRQAENNPIAGHMLNYIAEDEPSVSPDQTAATA
ncbi:MAG: hypothetical protein QMC74_00665 [Myxococcota bacterium]